MANFENQNTDTTTTVVNTQTLSELDAVCLKRVFKFLRLRDLCNVADVCKRFKTVAEQVFKSIYYTDKRTVDVLKLIKGYKHFHHEWFMVRLLTERFLTSAEQLFRNFGALIKSVQLTGTGRNGGMDETELLTLVKTYCSSLKELILYDVGNTHGIYGNDEFSTELRPLFGSLEKLSVSNCFGDDLCESFVALFSDCQNLKYLNVDGVSGTMWMNHKFPKLETLIISNSWEFEYNDFEMFLKNHENLRSLTCVKSDVFPIFFAMLLSDSPQLQTFHCNVDLKNVPDEDLEKNILLLPKLKSLRNLTFTCKASTLNLLVIAFEEEETPLEYFEIVDCEIENELIVGLSKMKTMKTLKLTQCRMTAEALTNISHHLNGLDKVVIEGTEEVDFNIAELSFAENVCLVNTTSEKSEQLVEQDSDILTLLPDGCLVEIFKFLPLRELCHVADVCKSFRRNARTVFQSQHKRINTLQNLCTTRKILGKKTDIRFAEQLFRNFGSFIQELSIIGGDFLKNDVHKEILFYLASKYCHYTKLKELQLQFMHIKLNMRWIRMYFNLFYQLQKLELWVCTLDANFGKFLSVCRIPVIDIKFPYKTLDWIKQTFTHLRSMSLYFTQQVSEAAVIEFVRLNKSHLHQLAFSRTTSELFFNILSFADHMPDLQQFSFSGTDIAVPLQLAKFKSLKGLTLDCHSFALKDLISELLKAETPLSELHITYGDVDMELLEKLGNIKTPHIDLTLKLVKMENVSLIDVVKKLPNLNELSIDIEGITTHNVVEMLRFTEKLSRLRIGCERSNVRINLKIYQSILGIVKCRQILNKLFIHITSHLSGVVVPKHVLLANSYWLQLESETTVPDRSVTFDESIEEATEDSPDELDVDSILDSEEELNDDLVGVESADEQFDETSDEQSDETSEEPDETSGEKSDETSDEQSDGTSDEQSEESSSEMDVSSAQELSKGSDVDMDSV